MKAGATIKCEFPRRQAMLSIWQKYVDHHGEWRVDTSTEVARVPVFVWPMPTQDGCFIVERQDGHCQKVQPYELTFLDSKELFDQYSWEEPWHEQDSHYRPAQRGGRMNSLENLKQTYNYKEAEMSITNELREWADGKDGMGISPFMVRWAHEIADRIDAEHEKAIRELNNLADACVLLPKDAYGNPWHIGDVVEWPDGLTAEVIGIGVNTLFYAIEGDCAEWTRADDKIHHYKPTVEELLRNFALEIDPCADIDGTGMRIIDEYARKLRLAEED